MSPFTRGASNVGVRARLETPLKGRRWYLKQLEQIALGEKCTAQQLSALKDLAKARGWNKQKPSKKKNGVSGAPGVSEELANRLQV